MTPLTRILYLSAWQIVNIGDIAHSPGALALLKKYLPNVEVTLWTFKPLDTSSRELIASQFPEVEIVSGMLDQAGDIHDPATLAAIDRSDFFLHGSGPATLGWAHAEFFARRTGRSFGVYGVTYGLYGIPEKAMLSRCQFVYFRDSISLARALADGVGAPLVGWAPDTAFAFEISDDEKAARFLQENELEEGHFLCCISRLRNTPFWLMHPETHDFDAGKHATNEEKKIADHAPLLEAILAVLRKTSLKILLCPEDESQMAVTREMLLMPLPAELRARVVWRETFWQPDEALGVYRRSAGLFGHEMHSPILCIGQGIPAIVCRWAEQSSKGEMWRDIGLGDWLFNLDAPQDAARVAAAVLAIAKDPPAAQKRAQAARDFVRKNHRDTLSTISDCLRPC